MGIHYTDAILTAIFAGEIAAFVWFLFQLNAINLKMTAIETKLNIMFASSRDARQFFDAKE
jgi:hypothetical protein